MTHEQIRERVEAHKRDERHANNSETRYWCGQWRLLAIDAAVLLEDLQRERDAAKGARTLAIAYMNQAEQGEKLADAYSDKLKAANADLRRERDDMRERCQILTAEWTLQTDAAVKRHSAALADALHYWLKRVRLSELADHEHEQFKRDSALVTKAL